MQYRSPNSNLSKTTNASMRTPCWCFVMFLSTVVFMYTVVPALGDPRRDRPPAVYGHVINVPTHFKVKLPAIGGHLPSADADSYLLVVRTCYIGQCKQMPRKSHVFCVKPAMSKKRTERFLVLTSAQRVEPLLSSWCGKKQIARIEANRMATKEPSWPRGIRAAGLI